MSITLSFEPCTFDWVWCATAGAAVYVVLAFYVAVRINRIVRREDSYSQETAFRILDAIAAIGAGVFWPFIVAGWLIGVGVLAAGRILDYFGGPTDGR